MPEQAYTLEWGRWGPPLSGVYHTQDDCKTLLQSHREVVPLPWPLAELEADDDWHECGHCAGPTASGNEGGSKAHYRSLIQEAKRLNG